MAQLIIRHFPLIFVIPFFFISFITYSTYHIESIENTVLMTYTFTVTKEDHNPCVYKASVS